MKRIMLASSSPRRKEIMKLLFGDSYEIVKSKYEEDNSLKIEPAKMAMLHAKGKAKDAALKVKEGIVIGGDTIVVLGKEVLCKPKDKPDARRMLEKISGNTVKVISGICVIDCESKKELVDYETTDVKFRKMSSEEIDEYIATGIPMDKAGAFGIWDKGCIFIERVDGCFMNVVGLPAFKLSKMLNEIGVDILRYKKD